MALEQIGNFLKLILKNGGGSFVLTLVLAWLFREYFDINPLTTIKIIEFMLWLAFFQSIFVLIRGEFFTTLNKWRDYRAGKSTVTEMDGKSVADVGKDIGLTTVVTLVEKGTEIREKLAESKEGRKKNKLQKELVKIDLEVERLEKLR